MLLTSFLDLRRSGSFEDLPGGEIKPSSGLNISTSSSSAYGSRGTERIMLVISCLRSMEYSVRHR